MRCDCAPTDSSRPFAVAESPSSHEDHRLLFVSPRSGWPNLCTLMGIAVLDRRTLGNTFDLALEWAQRSAHLVHVVAELDPGADPAGLEVDWPMIAEDSGRWSRDSSWPLQGEVHVDVAGDDPEGLLEARRRIADAARTANSWPGRWQWPRH